MDDLEKQIGAEVEQEVADEVNREIARQKANSATISIGPNANRPLGKVSDFANWLTKQGPYAALQNAATAGAPGAVQALAATGVSAKSIPQHLKKILGGESVIGEAKKFADEWTQNYHDSNKVLNQVTEDSPWYSAAGSIFGSALGPLSKVPSATGSNFYKSAPLLSQMAISGVESAAQGALQAKLEDRDAKSSAIAGGILGSITPAAIAGAQKAIPKAEKTINKGIDFAKEKFLNPIENYKRYIGATPEDFRIGSTEAQKLSSAISAEKGLLSGSVRSSAMRVQNAIDDESSKLATAMGKIEEKFKNYEMSDSPYAAQARKNIHDIYKEKSHIVDDYIRGLEDTGSIMPGQAANYKNLANHIESLIEQKKFSPESLSGIKTAQQGITESSGAYGHQTMMFEPEVRKRIAAALRESINEGIPSVSGPMLTDEVVSRNKRLSDLLQIAPLLKSKEARKASSLSFTPSDAALLAGSAASANILGSPKLSSIFLAIEAAKKLGESDAGLLQRAKIGENIKNVDLSSFIPKMNASEITRPVVSTFANTISENPAAEQFVEQSNPAKRIFSSSQEKDESEDKTDRSQYLHF